MTGARPVPTPIERPLRVRVMPHVFRVLNLPMRFVLGLPFATPLGGRLMLVYLTGRKSGRHYRQPVSYVRHDTTLLTPGGGRWKLNLVEDEPTRLRLRGRDVFARPELVHETEEIAHLLTVLTEANPAAARFVPIPRRSDGNLDPDRLQAAIDYGFRIVRWHLEPAPARPADWSEGTPAFYGKAATPPPLTAPPGGR